MIIGGGPSVYGRASLAPYTGQFATACGRLPSRAYPGNNLGMSRTRHIARSAVTSLKVAFPNYYVTSTNVETGPGAIATIKAGIEYSGSSTQVLWSGSASTTIADGATSSLSDSVSVTIPEGAEFFVRCWYSSSGGVLGNDHSASATADNANGESWRTDTLVVDETLGTGLIVNGTEVVGFIYVPVLLVATITKPSVLLLGDSRVQGLLDDYTGTSGDKGQLSRAFGAVYGYCETGEPGADASTFITSHTQRVALKTYFSHVVNEYGINDLNHGSSAATLAADRTTIAGYFPSQSVYGTTLPPETTSTDSWATTGNQTQLGTSPVTFNGLVRAGISGHAGYLDIADIVESARDSVKWKVNGTANWYTSDGVHETNTANIAIKDALAIPF